MIENIDVTIGLTNLLPTSNSKTVVRKAILTEIDEIQFLIISPWTAIDLHDHEENIWEVWLRPANRTAFVCLKGEQHELINESPSLLEIIAIKGHFDCSYDELAEFFYDRGYSVCHGSLEIHET